MLNPWEGWLINISQSIVVVKFYLLVDSIIIPIQVIFPRIGDHFVVNLWRLLKLYQTLCAIWYHLYSLKNMKNNHRGVLLLVKLQAKACNFTKINTSPSVIFTFFKIAQMVPNRAKFRKWIINSIHRIDITLR